MYTAHGMCFFPSFKTGVFLYLSTKIMPIQGKKSFVKILVIKLSYMQMGFAQAAELRCQIQSPACGSGGCQREQPVLFSKSFNIKLQVTIF